MKHLFNITALFFLTIAATAQTPYQKGMQKAFDMWKAGEAQEAGNLFERIAQAEPDNWLPPFYAAQVLVFDSFSEKDENKLVPQLKKAQDLVNDAKAISKDNAEILVLEAQLLTAWIVFDGQKYGMKYSGKVSELYNKANQLAPDNPRVVLGKAEWDMGAAKWFGKSTEPYCKDIKRAIELFATFTPQGEFHPKGGLEHAQEVLAQNCK
ncbi:hypothetical protein [Marinirhabdus gelatinilytica]|uniref:Tetratricopeptide repeat protein n=1 Tax=Marinirhabdus gelatinilytica TaxID=1703343 RepID=A0A370QFJ7_9FLAO|nr:hypothetical protein [Marinirhabdus gelatinilytica]RDK87137.1 hypothetical protein C8D94_102319 [Marinirhabdus gelatinilytica]